MIDLANTPGLLALGGIAAIVATGWQHVKLAFSHVSSLLIVSATMDHPVSMSVSLFLRKNWTLLPSSSVEYHGLLLKLKGDTTQSLVPFKLPPYSSSVFIKGRQVVVLNQERLVSIRGLCDLDQLISDGVKYRNEFHKTSVSSRRDKVSRFRVINVVGSEKGAWAAPKAKGEGKIEDSAAEAPTSGREPNPEVDKMLLYLKEDLAGEHSEDPFQKLPYDDNVMQMVEDLKHWFSMGDWYKERNIPWRRGVRLSGPPGTGKSTLVQAVAELLKIPLYVFHLPTLSSQEFIDRWQAMQTPCCAVFEDFDTSFDGREPLTEHKSLTFDCILNQISGVQNRSGTLLFVTTNCPEKIDSALGTFSELDTCNLDVNVSTRPGRLDIAVHIGPLSEKNKRVLACKTLRDWPDLIERAVSVSGEVTPAQFEEICIQLALRRIREQDSDRPAANDESPNQKVTMFNPAEDSPETAFQMAAVIALRDSVNDRQAFH